MNVSRRVATGLADYYLVTFRIPLEHRSRTDAQALAHFRRNGDLSLGRYLGMRKRHSSHITTVMKQTLF